MSEEYRGAMGGLEGAELDAFLASDALARVACLRPDGAPYVVPIWYQWDGTSLWFVGRERSEWCRFMQNDPRISVVIDKEHGRPDVASGEIQQIPKVIASGRAEIIETPNVGGKWVDIASKMAVRYLGENGPSYIESTLQAAALAHPPDPRRDHDLEGRRLGEALLGRIDRWSVVRTGPRPRGVT